MRYLCFTASTAIEPPRTPPTMVLPPSSRNKACQRKIWGCSRHARRRGPQRGAHEGRTNDRAAQAVRQEVTAPLTCAYVQKRTGEVTQQLENHVQGASRHRRDENHGHGIESLAESSD